MKKIPESFELSEEDIKAAITYWLTATQSTGGTHSNKFSISFSTDKVATPAPAGAPIGGMADYYKTVIVAKATRVQ